MMSGCRNHLSHSPYVAGLPRASVSPPSPLLAMAGRRHSWCWTQMKTICFKIPLSPTPEHAQPGYSPHQSSSLGTQMSCLSCLSSTRLALPWQYNSRWISAEPQPSTPPGSSLFNGLFASSFCSATFQHLQICPALILYYFSAQ